MGIEWDMIGDEYHIQRQETTKREKLQKYMDELPWDFCERLNRVNGFVTEIAAGHVISIGRESNVTGIPPSIRHTATRAAHMPPTHR